MNEYKVVSRMHSWQKSYPNWVSVVSILCLLVIWELICQSGIVSSLFLPAPTAIISALLQMIADGEIGVSLAASLYRILAGFFIGSLVGLAVGLV
ncbi:MAG: ABC transporter permease, partial [Phascolarctobacterium sp.]|nr:ABC transporter permease [Phascolarctobacterium sp.]